MEPQICSLHKDWIQEITAMWPKAPLEASRPSPCSNQGQRWCQTRLLRTLSCSVVKISIDRDVRASLGHCSSVQLHSLTPGWLIPVSIFPALPFWCWSSEKNCWISQAVPLPAWVPAHQMSQFLFCEHVLEFQCTLLISIAPIACSWEVLTNQFPKQDKICSSEGQNLYSTICLPYFSWGLNSKVLESLMPRLPFTFTFLPSLFLSNKSSIGIKK